MVCLIRWAVYGLFVNGHSDVETSALLVTRPMRVALSQEAEFPEGEGPPEGEDPDGKGGANPVKPTGAPWPKGEGQPRNRGGSDDPDGNPVKPTGAPWPKGEGQPRNRGGSDDPDGNPVK